MIVSLKPTNTILIEARTNSEFYSCDYVLLTLSNGFIEFIKEVQPRVKKLSKKFKDFFVLTLWGNPDDYYVANEKDGSETVLEYLITNGLEWCYVELDENKEYESIAAVLETDTIKFEADSFYFSGYSDGINEFWTSSVNISELLKTLK